MNSAWTRAVIVVLSLFVLTLFVGQVFFAGGDKISTETAYRYDYDKEIPFDGVFMRDETPVTGSYYGVLGYECADGSKVGKSTVVARSYKSEADVAYRRDIEALQKELEVLGNAEKLIGTDNSQLEAISAQINESHSAMINSILAGDFASAEEKRNSLLEAMCKREITLSESSGYSARKQALNAEIGRLTALLSGEVRDVTANGAGYFVSELDGYESEISFSDIDKMTAEKIADIVANPKKSAGVANAVGKLIADYRWRVAAVIDMENLFGVYEGSTVTLRVGSGSQLLKASVVSMKPCGDGKAVYVFECDKLTASVASGRCAKMKVLVDSYGGLRVPRKALRYNEKDERGVYIVRNSTISFRKVDVVYWGDDYVICSQKNEDGFLMLYDEIVTEGKELFDGKVIE